MTMDRTYGIAPPGFRLPDQTRIGAVHLQVAELTRSVAYYTQVLGLRLDSGGSDSAVLTAQGDGHPLVCLHARPGIDPAPRRGAFGLYHFAILLPDRPALGRFAMHLRALQIPAGMADHLVSEALYLSDPDGLGIEVYADRPRDTWRQRDRELAMATDPLDIADLVAAAGGQPWTGAPSGTQMGHVHLHVGDLDKAEAFYHAAVGFDKTVWSYPGALFMSAGGYHHHLGTNTWSPGPAASDDQARLLEWELLLPGEEDVAAARESIRAPGHAIDDGKDGFSVADPWGTRLRVRAGP
jgi:catechol 2,3-dioxygenase